MTEIVSRLHDLPRTVARGGEGTVVGEGIGWFSGARDLRLGELQSEGNQVTAVVRDNPISDAKCLDAGNRKAVNVTPSGWLYFDAAHRRTVASNT
jgi:hypothetical protein